MPRIAVAIMVVATIGVCIGVNIARFPVVWDMVSRPHQKAASQTPLPAPTLPTPAAPAREVVDLSDFAPPTIHASSPTPSAASPLPEPPTTEPTASQGANMDPPPAPLEKRGRESLLANDYSEPKDLRRAKTPDPFSPGITKGHLVSESRSGAGPAADDVDNHPPDATDPSAPGLLPADATAQGPAAEIAPPIRFGPATAAPMQSAPPGAGAGSLAFGDAKRGIGFGPVDASETTTWPAQLAPTLKLGAKPAIADDASGEWRDDRSLAPIRRANQEPADAAPSRVDAAPTLERLPKVLPSDSTTPWSSYDRRPEISKALYPTTGK